MKWFTRTERYSFAVRIFTYLMGAICISILLQTGMTLYQNENHLRADLQENGVALLRIFAQAIRPAVYAEDREAITRISEAMLQHADIRSITVFDQNFRMLHQVFSRGMVNDGKSCKELEILQEKNALEPLRPGSFISRDSPEVFSFVAPVFTRGVSVSGEALFFLGGEAGGAVSERAERIGYVCLCLDKKSLAESRRNSMESAFALAGVMLFLGGAVTFFISRAASAPIRQIIGKMREKGALPAEGGELERLSGAFDGLVHSLGDAFNTIADLKANLEVRILERTEELAHANEELSLRQEELISANANLEETLLKLKQTQAQLVQSEKMVAVGQLVAGVAHEVNNTVNFISGALPAITRLLDRMKSCLAGTSEGDYTATLSMVADMEPLLANIREGVRRTIRIVHDLRTFSRSAPEEDIRPTDIHRGMDSTLNLMHSEIKYKANVVRDYGENIPHVFCNPTQMNQVFMNILLNAVQAMPDTETGSITVSTSLTEDGMAQVSIADTGTGIPADILDRIFDPFFTTKPPGKGTGLGLSIAYSIVEKHGGRILVDSEEGRGTTFRILLPLGDRRKLPAQRSAESPRAA